MATISRLAKFANLINNQVLESNNTTTTNTDQMLKQLTKALADDVITSGNDQLFRIANDLIEAQTTVQASAGSLDASGGLAFLHEKKYWLFRRQISLDNMLHTFQSLPNKAEFKLLGDFFKHMRELEALKYLPSIVKMMHLIYAMFNRQIDKKTAGTIELEQLFVERARRGSHFANDYAFKDVVETGTLAFLRAWKIVRHSLDTRSSAKLNRDNELLQALIDDERKYAQMRLSFLLANASRDGVYLYSVVFYLLLFTLILESFFVILFRLLNNTKS